MKELLIKRAETEEEFQTCLNIRTLVFINEQNVFVPSESLQKSAQIMMRELVRWTNGLKLIKENKKNFRCNKPGVGQDARHTSKTW